MNSIPPVSKPHAVAAIVKVFARMQRNMHVPTEFNKVHNSLHFNFSLVLIAMLVPILYYKHKHTYTYILDQRAVFKIIASYIAPMCEQNTQTAFHFIYGCVVYQQHNFFKQFYIEPKNCIYR